MAKISEEQWDKLLEEMSDMRSYSAGLLHGLAQLTEWYDPDFGREWDIDWNDISSDYRLLHCTIKDLRDKQVESAYL